MTVPAPWGSLTADEKRRRTYAVADAVFAREGIDVPMPVIAEAIGAGVASVYRQVGSKDDLLAALVIGRSRVLRGRFLAALEEPDPWEALSRATHATVDDCVGDALSQSAWDEAAFGSAEVRAARREATDALAALVDRARAAGALRDDAGHEDLRLVFCALRELAGIGPRAAHRLAELVLRGMRA
ncbi:TetR/AcrR family transcriptional regulator [Miltoncostaea marina]|uniref:TetR/AcrR family transcriptional regulator n=1 Tax=Miltoncostaea marina TaxID=2843215 RepID=UPI001FEC549B|nr:TetR/AcrR family transcriptional regulator [Miltoncostaea marina]